MKKLLALALSTLLLAGCTTEDLLLFDGSRHFQVLQVVDDGFLALHCDQSSGTQCFGKVVFIPNSVDPDAYDEKIIFMKKPIIVDRYTYETVKGTVKTVPVMIDQP